MSKTIYLFELRTKLRSVIIWSVSIVALILIFGSLFSSMADQAQMMNALLEKFPAGLKAAFGLNNYDFSSVLGYFSFLFVFVQLCVAIQAGNYGFGLVSVEESELTADFLLSKPVSRVQVLTSKLLAALTCLIATDLVIWAVGLGSIALFSGGRVYDMGRLLLMLSSIVIFQLFFLSVGLVISLLVKRIRNVTPYALGLAFGAYILNAFSGVFQDIKLEYITPFRHLDPSYIISNGSLNTPLVLINVTVTVISIAVTYWLYTRRDIHAVS